MISISRISLISSHLYSVKCLSPFRTYSILQLTRHKIFNDLRPAQTFFALKQRSISSDKELKEKIETSHAKTIAASQLSQKASLKQATSHAKTIAATQLSQKARLKQAVRDYGATIIVFHVAISLASLGICYVAVSNGIDAVSWLQKLGFPESVISSKVAVESSTFLMSYAVHKLFAPVRIGITLSTAPFIVRYLRKKNLIKPPK